MNKSIKYSIQVGTCALVLGVMACSQDGAEPSADETDVSDEQAPQMRMSDTNASAGSESLGQQVSGAIADLATRSGTPANAIAVSGARTVTWGSSAVGCPKEGMSYTQAIVPGVLVILKADGVLYRYHGRLRTKLVYCPDERAKEPAYGPGQEFM